MQAYRLLDILLPKARKRSASRPARCAAAATSAGWANMPNGRRGAAAWRSSPRSIPTAAAGDVAPPGGTEGRISTNPLCLGASDAGDPLVLDIGTSVVAEGKVRVAFKKVKQVPDGWLLDDQGKPTNDPGDLYNEPRGTILPFGGPQAYKGFGLGLLLDVLAGGLSGGHCSRPRRAVPGLGNAVVFILFDTSPLRRQRALLKETGNLANFVRGTPTRGRRRIDHAAGRSGTVEQTETAS